MVEQRLPAKTPRRRLRRWVAPAGIVLVAGLLIAFTVVQNDSQPPSAESPASSDLAVGAAPSTEDDLTSLEDRDAADVQAAGPIDAPVGLVVYADYQCPYCASWAQATLPAMMTYAEAGDLRIEWRDTNMYGEASERAARAAHAAGLQGMYWEFHAALYPNGEHRSESELSDASLTAVAEELGLDPAQFSEDMNSSAVRDTIAAMAQEAQALGVTGTPSFLVDGQPVVGAQPTQVFVDAVELALVESGR